MRPILSALAAVVAMGAVHAARADEQMIPLVSDGNWIALEHKTDLVSKADVCIMYNTESNTALRYGGDILELRITNEKWSLPSDLKGKIIIAFGSSKKTLDVVASSSNTIASKIEDDYRNELFSGMDQKSSMTLTIGHEKPIAVSLKGSKRVAAAFKNCAGIHDETSAPGGNPFN